MYVHQSGLEHHQFIHSYIKRKRVLIELSCAASIAGNCHLYLPGSTPSLCCVYAIPTRSDNTITAAVKVPAKPRHDPVDFFAAARSFFPAALFCQTGEPPRYSSAHTCCKGRIPVSYRCIHGGERDDGRHTDLLNLY